ncbi:MAG TPA: hypothetical protein VFU21_20080 [Kofleriaceae bacterium]|nr:hypothetical protein [Kofleriaceae bacterium]
MRRAALLALFAATAACGGKARTDHATPGGGQGTPEQAVLGRFQALDDEVEKTRGQCPKLATSIDGWLEANQEPVRALLEQSRTQPGLAGDDVEEVEQHLERIFDRVVDAVTTCKGQGGVDQAYARLDAFLEAS